MLEQIPDTLAARGSHDNAPSLLLPFEEEDHDDHGHDVEEFSHHISLLLALMRVGGCSLDDDDDDDNGDDDDDDDGGMS